MNYVMEVTKTEEAGYYSALKGLALNKKQDKDMTNVALKLSDKDYGHNKFLESIYVWLEVKAPRYWWQEADTFRLSTKQSESTMHTLIKDFEEGKSLSSFFEDWSFDQLEYLEDILTIKEPIEKLVKLKQNLLEGFLQKRLWCMSYKTLRNIIIQRRTHRLPHWKSFIEQVLNQVEHPELLPCFNENIEKGMQQSKEGKIKRRK